MPDMTAPIKLGANVWNQWTEWPAFLEAHRHLDAVGFDSIWTWDHLYPILGSPDGPIFEGYTAMSAVASVTSSASVGLLVGANTFRLPSLVAKMATTLDHISGGRAVLGIGGAWFETEHHAFGMPFGSGPGERLAWLGEALPLMRDMLDGRAATAGGERYRAREVRNDPLPLQQRLPILVGGSGPNVTLKLVARWADACNLTGSLPIVQDREARLLRHCQTVGRDETEIERTLNMGVVVLRDTRASAEQVLEGMLRNNGDMKLRMDSSVGTVDDLVARCKPFVELGYRHFIFGFPAPYDHATMDRLMLEARPRLEALAS